MFSLLIRSQMPSLHKFRKQKMHTFRSSENLVPETMAGNVPHSRILRFCVILVAVILTIFIYATYSTNEISLPTPSLRTAAQIASSRSADGNFGNPTNLDQSFPLLSNSPSNNKTMSGSSNVYQSLHSSDKPISHHLQLKQWKLTNNANTLLNFEKNLTDKKLMTDDKITRSKDNDVNESKSG